MACTHTVCVCDTDARTGAQADDMHILMKQMQVRRCAQRRVDATDLGCAPSLEW
jgi:hypothetical protein